jgi:hypothetical protein
LGGVLIALAGWAWVWLYMWFGDVEHQAMMTFFSIVAACTGVCHHRHAAGEGTVREDRP